MTAITLKEVPEDVLKIILLTQADIKSGRGVGQFSMEKTIYKIVREYDKMKQAEKEKQNT